MEFKVITNGFEIYHNGKCLLVHSEEHPSLFVGYGQENIEIYRGNFDIQDYVESRIPLPFLAVEETKDKITIAYSQLEGAKPLIIMHVEEENGDITLNFKSQNKAMNRFWLRLPAEENEKVWGCGEQMSYFNMRGRHFPLWTSEPGVGRDKTTEITFKCDVTGKSGGDYYHTNYPQPTFISSRYYACHVETTAYADFDFRASNFHELQIWEVPSSVILKTASSYLDLVTKLSDLFGRQPKLPEWVYNGVILGLKGGEENSFSRMENAIVRGLPVAALWCEDWVGLRVTSFGRRLFWDWKWSKKRYPNLDKKIKELNTRGIRFMSYINPYLCEDGELFQIAKEKGFFAKNNTGEIALVDFGEFYCGIVDFTIPEACTWFKDVVIKQNNIDLGISGWMADFGEYLPTDNVYLANGIDATLMHNAWPTLWAKVNAEGVEEAGKRGEILFFMRAGYTGIQRYCPLLWAGDQSVDFSRHDGLNTVICAALSSGLMGNAYHHSDIGGYTSLFGNRRTKELFERWTDMAAFTPVMRTHEGNRPDENFQFDQDAGTIAHFTRMTTIYKHLVPYLKTLVDDAYEKGYPVQRALFLHYENDPQTYEIQDQYLYGSEMLIAPVHKSGVLEWTTYLPANETWVHAWSGEEIQGGQSVTRPAPIGQPPVFYRKESSWNSLFSELKSL